MLDGPGAHVDEPVSGGRAGSRVGRCVARGLQLIGQFRTPGCGRLLGEWSSPCIGLTVFKFLVKTINVQLVLKFLLEVLSNVTLQFLN